MTLFEKINAIMADVQYLAKDDHVAFGNTKYKALSEEKVTSIMRAEMVKHKLIVYPVRQQCTRAGTITHVDVAYRMVNVENPEEYIEIASCGDGADTQDKGSGKAMTYAFKYMWLRTFALPTGEDPDKISSAELDEKAAQASAPTQEPPLHERLQGARCGMCGKTIEPVKKRDGSLWPVEEMVTYSAMRFQKCLCAACMKLAQKEEDKQGG